MKTRTLRSADQPETRAITPVIGSSEGPDTVMLRLLSPGPEVDGLQRLVRPLREASPAAWSL